MRLMLWPKQPRAESGSGHASKNFALGADTLSSMTISAPGVPLRPRPRWGYGDAAWAVAAGLVGAGVVNAVLVAVRHSGDAKLKLDGFDNLVMGVAQFATMAGLMWLTVGRRGYGLRHAIGLRVRLREIYWVLIGMGAAIGFGLLAFPIASLWQQGDHPKQAIGQELKNSTSATRIGFLILVVVVAPLVEEMVFRGVVLRASLRRMPAAPAVLVSGGSFALLHLLDVATLPGIPQLFGVGVVSAMVALRSGDLSRSIYFHAGFNLLAAIGLVM